MFSINRILERIVVALTMLVSVAIGTRAGAQELLDRQALLLEVPPAAVFTDAQFDQWAFGGMGRDEVRRRLERRLTSRVNEVDRICSLTDDQKKKLYLAGRSDIRRFFDEVDEMKQTVRDRQRDPLFVGRVFPNSRPSDALNSKDFFAEKSLLGKILKRTLGNEQFVKYEKVKGQERRARYQATLKWVVANLDTTLHLSADQHGRLAVLLAAETRPPRVFGEYDYFGVLFQLSRLPESRVKPIFDPGQWAKLQVQLAAATRLAHTLEERGFLPDDGVAAHAPGPKGNDAIMEPEDEEG
jgi:hypothetical protein